MLAYDQLVAETLDWVGNHRLDDGAGVPITASTDLLESGILDSISFVHLVAFLTERTGSTADLSDVDPEVFATVGGLCGVFASDG